MRHPLLARAALAAALAFTLAQAARAQHPATGTAPARFELLDALPPSDFVIYADVRRILDVAAPRVAGPNQRAALDRLARSLADLRRMTGIDPRAVTRFAAGGSYDALDPEKSTGVVLVECSLSAREVAALLSRNSRATPRAARVAGREAYFVSGADILPASIARARTRPARPQDVYVTELAPGIIALGDRASVARSLSSLSGDVPRSLGLEALPWAGRSAPLFSIFFRVPPQAAAPEVPAELKAAGMEEFFQTLSSIREVQMAVGMEGDGFPFMMSVRADSAQTAGKIYTAAQSLGPAVDQAQSEAEPGPAARQAEEFLRSLQLSVSGEYITLSGTLKSATLRAALESAAPKARQLPAKTRAVRR